MSQEEEASNNKSNDNGGTEPLTALIPSSIPTMSYASLVQRKQVVTARLAVIGTKPMKKQAQSTDTSIPFIPKSDTHWDFMLKEMAWLAADFSSERKRQLASGKKLAGGVEQYLLKAQARRARELAEAELKRRRLAGKLSRHVRGWWHKVERVIAYKQKVHGDVERRKAMNKQLVALVHQTERYGETLQHSSLQEKEGHVTIEEALAAAAGGSNTTVRSSKSMATNYARLNQEEEVDEFYGTTTSESGSDASFHLEAEDSDDESTLLEAQARELAERRTREESDDEDDASYYADPNELLKLKEEAEMQVDQVVERFRQEAEAVQNVADIPEQVDNVESVSTTGRRVRFAGNVEQSTSKGGNEGEDTQEPKPAATTRVTRRQSGMPAETDPGNEADDDGDISDVEDFVDDHIASDDGSDEFEADRDEKDDETTIEAEERLGRDMSAADEINLLQQEGEMSIEELRIMYSSVDNGGNEHDEEEDPSENVASSSSTHQHAQTLATDNGSTGMDESMFDADDTTEQDEFQPDAMEIDDETTMEAEERLGREISHEQEMSLLEREGEIPIEQLRATYAEMESHSNDDEMSIDSETQSRTSQNETSFGNMLERGASDEDGEEFRPDEVAGVDDETTMEAEERLGRDMSYQDEINLLKREREMSVEALRLLYAGDGNAEANQSVDESIFDEDDHESEDEFRPAMEAVDDETTMEAEERLGREMSVEDEIALLQKEGETSVDHLRAMYNQMDDISSDTNEDQQDQRRRQGRKRSRPESDGSDSDDDGDAALEALKVAEEKARMTYATRPFLIAPWVKLREYQQIGLNWLVSIQTRRLNAILADEMGLGKTLQTIALLAYLAAYKGIWGPHLIVVPTSCIVNWETEFKRFAPGLKVLCYYGSAKRRKELRSGWTKANWHHVVVTSYQLVVQDSFAFKRKKWYYLILDEAHNIKNFESQRWQTLINFNTQRRLLLTGTPLQNNLMELWSLLHFLMPHVFRSRKEFSYWFSNPMNNIIEGNVSRSDDLINRLHGIIRPFVLRRLKKDVEKQMPGKFEHIVKCQLSRRQMFLYEEFMARSSTRQALKKGGNFMGMMNVLMQLRKVCNHPDLFEPRSIVTPFVMNRISLNTAGMIVDTLDQGPFHSLSTPLLNSLWTCSSGGVDQHQYLNHDTIVSEQLCRLEESQSAFTSSDLLNSEIDEPLPTEGLDADLVSLLSSIRATAIKEREAEIDFQRKLSSTRCRASPFPYSSRLVDAATVEIGPFERDGPEIVSGTKIISTPTQLLALRKSQQQRADDVDDLMKKFVFCVPKVGAPRPVLDVSVHDTNAIDDSVTEVLMPPLEQYFRSYQKAHARLSSFFPDKKLIQFDAGKLRTLAKLLRELKQGGHRALIFTQMSKMLDVLEAFLNMNGFTYLRLDGSTGVEKRQRMMDRFNSDPRIFCFILSTRSGGLGINLTGADSVIFYDSDWNPAMDAQAQDRAHRIGQTRDVHIYRLITEHSIEENILTKAQQKRNLDLLVMDEGKFDASRPKEEKSSDVFSKGGLRSILGVDAEESNTNKAAGENDQEVTKEQMEKTMASLEDDDDVQAMRGAQKEADDELREFDESIEYAKEEGEDADNQNDKGETSKAKLPSKEEETAENGDKEEPDGDGKKSETEMQREFEAWQSEVGMDAASIEGSLTPTERYALNFREDIDPFYSIFAVNEYKRKMEVQDDVEEIDLDELERNKEVEERRALEDGDLLGTFPRPEDLVRQSHLYSREKSRLRSSKKRRKLTGENWETRIDGSVNHPYWYNVDTGEAIWDKPLVLLELEAYNLALEKHWNALPLKPLVHIMKYLVPFPEKTTCSLVCKHWHTAATDVSFVRHVYPVEMQGRRQLEYNHYRTIEEAVSDALPGDTIELGDGHYWVLEPGLNVTFPLRFIGDEHDPSHVIIELSGTVQWSAKGGWMEGITFRRPRMDQTGAIIRLHSGGRIDMGVCVLDNEGSQGPAAIITGEKSVGTWSSTEIKRSEASNGAIVEAGATLALQNCIIMNNHGDGVSCRGTGSSIQMRECLVQGNHGTGLRLVGDGTGQLTKCRFVHNGDVLIADKASSCSPCTDNVAVVSSSLQQTPLPGFRVERENQSAADLKQHP